MTQTPPTPNAQPAAQTPNVITQAVADFFFASDAGAQIARGAAGMAEMDDDCEPGAFASRLAECASDYSDGAFLAPGTRPNAVRVRAQLSNLEQRLLLLAWEQIDWAYVAAEVARNLSGLGMAFVNRVRARQAERFGRAADWDALA